MVRKKPPEKVFKTRYVPCLASAKRCTTCKCTGEVEKETGGPGACPDCGGNGWVAIAWEVSVAA